MPLYKENDKMSELVGNHYELLQVLSRFGLPLGFGDKTVKEVCEQNNVHTPTFLAVANYKEGFETCNPEDLSIKELMNYLQKAHGYFLDFCFPMIRRKLIEAINSGLENKVALLILHYFDAYSQEVYRHMEYEDKMVFVYVEQLLKGLSPKNYSIEIFAEKHRAIDDEHVTDKLTELKNIIIKYYPAESGNDLLNSALFDIFTCEKDLATHCLVEDNLFVPAVRLLEKNERKKQVKKEETDSVGQEALSQREKDIVVGVVKGLTNKEIAEQLFLSVHTVITHRRNIARKLQIHSSAGLTIYAIVNQLIDINELPVSSLNRT